MWALVDCEDYWEPGEEGAAAAETRFGDLGPLPHVGQFLAVVDGFFHVGCLELGGLLISPVAPSTGDGETRRLDLAPRYYYWACRQSLPDRQGAVCRAAGSRKHLQQGRRRRGRRRPRAAGAIPFFAIIGEDEIWRRRMRGWVHCQCRLLAYNQGQGREWKRGEERGRRRAELRLWNWVLKFDFGLWWCALINFILSDAVCNWVRESERARVCVSFLSFGVEVLRSLNVETSTLEDPQVAFWFWFVN